MLLSHAVLAVVFGGLVVSAYPEPGGGRDYYEPELHMTEGEFAHEQDNVARQGETMHYWAPNNPQQVMATEPVAYAHSRPSHFPWPKEPEPQPSRPVPEPPLPPWAPVPEPPEEGPVPPPLGSPPAPPEAPTKTIYQFLKESPAFSRIFKLVNYAEDITSLLNDTSAKLTFFALPNWAFPHPPHRHQPTADWYERDIDGPEGYYDALAAAEGLVDLNENDADKDKKTILKAILKAILKYQTLPAAHLASELAKNVTYATSLTLSDGSLDGEPLRIRVSAAPGLRGPRLSVNLLSKIVHADIVTQNGVIHIVTKPILPPPSVFQLGFFSQNVFSILTSAIQRVGLTDAIEWRDVRDSDGKHTVDGSPAVTVFAPTNRAFTRLPPKLHHFLFSPFGERVLKKLLQFHIAPEIILHADYVHNASESIATHATLQLGSKDVIGLYEELHRTNTFSVSSDDLDAEAKHGFGSFPDAVHPPPWHMGRNPGGPPQCGPPPSSPPPSNMPHDDPWGHTSTPPCGPWHMPPTPPPPSPPPHHPDYYYPGYEDYSHMSRYRSYLRQPPPHQRPDHAEYYSPYYPLPYQPSFEYGPHFPPHGPPPSCSPYTRPFEHGPRFPPFHPHCPQSPIAPHHPPFGHGHQFPPFHPHCPPPPPVTPHHPPECTPPPPHHLPFEHGPQFPPSPHCSSPPPPPHGPSHPPFERGPHLPHFPQPGEHRHEPFAHCPHFPPHGFPTGSVHRPPFPRPKVVYYRNLTTPTLLGNHSVNVQVAQFAFHTPIPGHHRTSYYTKTFVHGTPVLTSDIPTRNGVLHVIDKLLNPRKTHTDPRPPFDTTSDGGAEFSEDDPEAEWEGWEEWLVQWANEE